MAIKYKGRWKNKQCNPNKPSKYHIKTCGDISNSKKIFDYLLSPLGSGHYVLADSSTQHIHCFSILLIWKLLHRYRSKQPKKLSWWNKTASSKVTETKALQKWYRISCCFMERQDSTKLLIVVSSKFVKGSVEVCTKWVKKTNKPDIIHNYNQWVNGCDRLDQLASYYSNVERRQKKH